MPRRPPLLSTISGYVDDGDPSVVYWTDGTGYTPSGEVLVGTYDGFTNTWVAYEQVYADSSGNIANGHVNADCADNDAVCILGYDYTTATSSNCVVVHADCEGSVRPDVRKKAEPPIKPDVALPRMQR